MGVLAVVRAVGVSWTGTGSKKLDLKGARLVREATERCGKRVGVVVERE